MKKVIFLMFIGLHLLSCNTQDDFKSISTKELKVILDNEKIQLLDVRTPEEFELGALKNAKFINYFDADFKEQSLKILDKEKPVYVYCRSGNRSAKACKILKNKGFDVINVVGGYNQWKA